MESKEANSSPYSPERPFAQHMDLIDPLKTLRADFCIPTKQMLATTSLSKIGEAIWYRPTINSLTE